MNLVFTKKMQWFLGNTVTTLTTESIHIIVKLPSGCMSAFPHIRYLCSSPCLMYNYEIRQDNPTWEGILGVNCPLHPPPWIVSRVRSQLQSTGSVNLAYQSCHAIKTVKQHCCCYWQPCPLGNMQWAVLDYQSKTGFFSASILSNVNRSEWNLLRDLLLHGIHLSI